MQEDPIKAWEDHNETLHDIRDYLNEKKYVALEYQSATTDLRIQLPKGHIWAGGTAKSVKGVIFNPNMPTEEVFTAPATRRCRRNCSEYEAVKLQWQFNR